MKHMRKLASLLLVLVMLFAMTAAVLADEGTASNSITVNKVQSDETYKLFKMFDLVVSEDLTAYSYTINENWETFFTTGTGKDYITLDNGYVKWNESKADAASMEAFGKAAAAYAAAQGVAVIQTITAGTDDTSITFTGLEPGYYLITSSNGSLAIVDTTPTNPAATVNEKNENPTLDKEVKEDGTGNWGKENTAQIGDTVEFKTTITLKKGAKNYVMHDKMDAGLTFDGQVEIEGLKEGTEFIVEDNPDDGCTFEVVFDQTYLDSLNGDTVLTVTYTATLNENAVDADGNRKDQKNDAKLTWGDKSGTGWSETVTKTFQFDLIKYDAKDNTKTPIAGAVFQLQDKDGNVIYLRKVNDHTYKIAAGDDVDSFALTEGEELLDSFTTVAGTKITIIGLDLEDTYYLVELTAPEGYNKLNDKVEVKVNAENTYVVEVPNSTGTELPSTGGMGTTLFYVFGSALLIGAAVLLITKKRMGANA